MKSLMLSAALLFLSTSACGTDIYQTSSEVTVGSDENQKSDKTSLNGTINFCNFKGCIKTLKEGCQGGNEPLCAAQTLQDVLAHIPSMGYSDKYITTTLLCSFTALTTNKLWKVDANASFQALHIYFSEQNGVIGFGTETDNWQQDCGYTYFYGTIPSEACGHCPQP